MGDIISLLENALNEKVKLKGNNTKKLKHKASRVTDYAPEVMVKITSFGKGGGQLRNYLMYISREENVRDKDDRHIELENERGEIFKGKKQIEEIAKQWSSDFDDHKRRKNQRDSVHIILSMPPGIEPNDVKDAVRSFAKETFSKNHEYLFALHTDSEGGNPHCHIAVKMKGFNGKTLHIAKGEPQKWRQTFANELGKLGVAAEATQRKTRGVSGHAPKTEVYRMNRTDKTHKHERVSRVKAALIRSVTDELIKENKGEQVIPDKQKQFYQQQKKKSIKAWLTLAEALEKDQIPITFKGREINDDRNKPDYERTSISNARSRNFKYAAKYLPKPDTYKHGRQAPAKTLTSVRELSGLDVVHDPKAIKMLLSADSFNSMGRGKSGANYGLRRSGIGDTGIDREGKPITNTKLAEKIRKFVASMPGVETERDRVRRSLVAQFTKQQVKTPEQKKGATRAAPNTERSNEPER